MMWAGTCWAAVFKSNVGFWLELGPVGLVGGGRDEGSYACLPNFIASAMAICAISLSSSVSPIVS